jgi:hypothetical protein
MERRTKPRISKPFRAYVSGKRAGGTPFEIETRVENVSASGLYILMEENMAEGAKLSIMIRLSTSETDEEPAAQVQTEGVVVRTEDLPNRLYGVGIRFLRYYFL